MTAKFGRLALHMWTIDTTPSATALDAAKQAGFDAVELRRTDFKRCFDDGMTNAQVLDLIKKSGIPVRRARRRIWLAVRHRRREQAAVRGVPRNLRERGGARLRHADERAGPGRTARSRTRSSILKRAGDIAAEYKLKLAIEYNSQHDGAQPPAGADRADRRRQQAELRLPDRRLSLHAQRASAGAASKNVPGRQDLLLPVQRRVAQSGHRRARGRPTGCRPARAS